MLEDGRLSSFAAGMLRNAGNLLSVFSCLQRKGELVRHVTGMPDKQFLEMLERVTRELEAFINVVELGNREAVEALFDQMLQAVTLRIRDLLQAERASIFLVDAGAGVLRSRIAHGEGGRPIEIRIPLSTGIAGRVARTSEVLNIPEPSGHPDFNAAVDRETGFTTRSILCMPVYDRAGKVFAVVELVNKAGGGPFSSDDERRFREFAAPLGLILESCGRLGRPASPPRG
ncbi:MAG: GAF domain-containing protein [Elusimicrobia bacterium]|nr:GAF domain-containing protein [Elusimicrobiota bacterium]MDE2236846.1 GAF domain-containing protein [Elusimicrobiota bacterium]MDE2425951.1 GAF domain-containing protein [Elusimicrobiota bacterium]